MKPWLFLFSVTLLLLSCTATQEQTTSPKSIEIGVHPNIETVMILRAISPDDYFFSRVSPGKKGRPMLYRARQAFATYAAHPAVAETQRLLNEANDIGGVLLQGVLYAHTLPDTGLQEEPADAYWKEHKAELQHYLTLLADFYKQAGVADFLAQNKDFYDGAIAEAKQYINDSTIVTMERYFGKSHAAYHMYLMPMCPYGWGFSGSTVASGNKSLYAIISPVGNIKGADTITQFTTFGYGGEEAPGHYRELVIHEFVHSFITDVIERDSFRRQIARYDSLYTPALDSAMGEQGYSGWWSYVNEHLVRLGHTRVAAMMDKNEADLLRQSDKEAGFILLPEFEKLMNDYETHRDQYKTIDDFLPRLIEGFGKFDREMVDERL